MSSRFAALFSMMALSSFAAVAAAQDFDPEGEAAMLDRINALRVEQELAPLARLDALDAVARAHSSEMARIGQLAHVSEHTGTPEDRVRNAGVGASTIAENVAMHRDATQAQEALVQSPAHRGNMLGADVTHVGLGAVRTAQGVYVTQVFAAVPPEPAVAAAPLPEPEEPAATPAPIFELIPPFVEQILGAPIAVGEAEEPSAAPAAPSAAAPSAAAPSAAAPSAAVPSAAAPSAPAPAAPAAPSASEAPASSTDAPAAPSAEPRANPIAGTLRQIVGLAQSLLGQGDE